MNMRRDYTIIITIIVSLNLDDAADNHIHIVGDAFIFRLRSSVSLFPSMSVFNVSSRLCPGNPLVAVRIG